MQRLSAISLLAAGLAACSPGEPTPPVVVDHLSVSIDANNDCMLGQTRVECREVATVIRTRYPTSKPRIDICVDQDARYEAAVEVMSSVGAAGFPVGDFKCAEG